MMIGGQPEIVCLRYAYRLPELIAKYDQKNIERLESIQNLLEMESQGKQDLIEVNCIYMPMRYAKRLNYLKPYIEHMTDAWIEIDFIRDEVVDVRTFDIPKFIFSRLLVSGNQIYGIGQAEKVLPSTRSYQEMNRVLVLGFQVSTVPPFFL